MLNVEILFKYKFDVDKYKQTVVSANKSIIMKNY